MRSIILSLIVFTAFSAFSQSTKTKKWRKTENDSMQKALLLYEDGLYLLALPIYEQLYSSHPNEEFLKYVYGRCALYRNDKHETALTLLNEVYTKNKKADDIEYDLARAYHFNYKFDEADQFAEKYLNQKKLPPENKAKAQQLKKYISNAKYFYTNPTNAKITNAGNVLNTQNEEYVPVITADESKIIFTYAGTESTGGRQNAFQEADKFGIFYEDVFQSVKVNDEWTKPYGLSTINTKSHDAAIAISPDGNQLFTYKDSGDDHGDIYVSYLKDTAWTIPVKLKGDVNSYSWEGSCSLSSDGRTLYFSSERGGGYGGRDIYRATMLADSSWGNVINLGDSINTLYDDDAPFIHPDGITLFYSSKGKNSMGDYDVFQAKMNPVDSVFGNAVNLGYPINTPDGDRYYVLSANGKTGYYSSGKKGGFGLSDIYTVDPGYLGEKPAIYLVKGKITVDKTPVEAEIQVHVTSKNNRPFTKSISNKNTGNYLITLPAGAVFKITYSYKDFESRVLEIDAANIKEYSEKEFNIDFNVKPVIEQPAVASNTTTVTKPKEPVVKPEPIVKKPVEKPEPVVKNTPKNTEAFVPKNAIQQKVMNYAAKYGDISAEGLEFRVQIAAYKFPKNYTYAHLKGLGKVENLLLEDGITRITIGGNFSTLGNAFEHNKKVAVAGQPDAFVTVLYKGKRVFLEELETMGIFVVK